ncbi:hypothetical protein Tco_0157658 [Tanacetum coccineum]
MSSSEVRSLVNVPSLNLFGSFWLGDVDLLLFSKGPSEHFLAKDKGFGHEMHKGEESEAVYGVTPLKDYAHYDVMVTDIQERIKSKSKQQNRARERKDREKSKRQSQSQTREVDLE